MNTPNVCTRAHMLALYSFTCSSFLAPHQAVDDGCMFRVDLRPTVAGAAARQYRSARSLVRETAIHTLSPMCWTRTVARTSTTYYSSSVDVGDVERQPLPHIGTWLYT
jgi:hypothetical protein